jgi:hypothetical protein
MTDDVPESIPAEHREAYKQAVDVVVGNTGADRDIAAGFLERKAQKNPQMVQDFVNRDIDPAAWNQTLRRVAKEFPKKLNERTPEPNEWANKTGPEANKEIKARWGFDPGWR